MAIPKLILYNNIYKILFCTIKENLILDAMFLLRVKIVYKKHIGIKKAILELLHLFFL